MFSWCLLVEVWWWLDGSSLVLKAAFPRSAFSYNASEPPIYVAVWRRVFSFLLVFLWTDPLLRGYGRVHVTTEDGSPSLWTGPLFRRLISFESVRSRSLGSSRLQVVGLLSPAAQRGADFIVWQRVRVGATVRRKKKKRNGFPGDLEPKLATGGGAWDTIMLKYTPV